MLKSNNIRALVVRRFRRPAFTLIEVLVVLAIILLLAALLFPVFNSARTSARIVTCQNNERQIGMAMQLYLSDYNNLYPLLGAQPDNCTWTYNIAPYVKSNAVFSCPEELYRSFEPGCQPIRADGDLRFSFEGAYSLDVPSFRQSGQMSATRIKAPAQMILVIDGEGHHLGVYPGNTPLTLKEITDMFVALRHKNGANALFADGHVKWMSLDALTDRSHWTLSGAG